MQAKVLHPWNVSSQQAVEVQRRLAPLVSRANAIGKTVRHVAGLDISAPDSRGLAKGAAVVVELPGLEVVEVQVAEVEPAFPYVPGLLSFREIPVLVEAIARLALVPDVILVDGQGVAHPRRLGIACHIGLLYDLPTIGCAKSVLTGRHEPLGVEEGSCAHLKDGGEIVGAAVRTRAGSAPVYVSIGHKVDLPAAIELVLACVKGHRLPEPTRLAHEAAAGRLAAGPARREPTMVQPQHGKLL